MKVNRTAHGDVIFEFNGARMELSVEEYRPIYSAERISKFSYIGANGLSKSSSYTYSTAGNILSKTVNGSTSTYTYGDSLWKDILTEYNGQSITYDTIGNPLSYRGWTFTWKNGRELSSAVNAGNTISYTYDAGGIRLSKTVNGVLHSYIYSGSKVLSEKYGNTILNFSYDEQGRPENVQYSTDNGASFATYYYVCNLQGDVLKIIDTAGSAVATYTYSAFGRVLTTFGQFSALTPTIAEVNPLLYKGYYRDSETGFYYLCSRYYDPETCRFINADGYIFTDGDILGLNMFSYCSNNAVNMKDPKGNKAVCVPIDDGGYRDVTIEIMRALNKETYLIMQECACAPKRIVDLNYCLLMSFKEKVNHEQKWDIKRKEVWEKTIETSFPGNGKIVVFNGEKMTPEILGNYTYGYLGCVYGFDIKTLICGSVYAWGGNDFGSGGLSNEVFDDWPQIRKGYNFAQVRYF